ncbi:unnamed protein product [Strongylus vulgaris]|uniref:G-protein coupled receptors family 1 profile domain-containing protein n=1 Tax=Strongylus vulgaris TaxID=40348 RepID=A0A3P7JJE6_STRVU|nr:unnamed protein product [Strongylus vulgaris]
MVRLKPYMHALMCANLKFQGLAIKEKMYYDHVHVNASAVDGFEERVTYHTVNTTLGVACTIINIVLLIVFLGYRPFRTRYVVSSSGKQRERVTRAHFLKATNRRSPIFVQSTTLKSIYKNVKFDGRIELLIQLGIGDLIYSVAAVLTGLHRIQLYSTAATTLTLPLLIQLGISDLIYSVAAVLTGLHRIQLYSTAATTLTLPVRTTADCATELWLQLKLIGDLLIPVTIFWMGVERFTAISFPLFYRMNVDGKPLK